MRAKIILPNFLAVLVLGLGGYFYLTGNLNAKAVDRLSQRMQTTGLLYERSESLYGFELLNNVNNHAMSKYVLDAFAPVDSKDVEGESAKTTEQRIRSEWFRKCVKAVEVYTELWSEKKGKRPEMVFLTDRKGVVIARNTTANACPAGYNVSQVMPVVKRALDGQSSYEIWSIDDSPFSSKKSDPNFCNLINTGLVELAAAPVWYKEDIAGVLVIGFEVSNGTAKKKAEMIGLEVAVLNSGDVYSTSFDADTTRQSLEKQMDIPEIAKKIDAAVSSGQPSGVFELSVENKPYMALISPVTSASKKDRVVTVIMGSIDDATADNGSLIALLIFMGVGLLIVFIAGAVLTNHFLGPVMAIEEGLLKVINGEYNYRFDVKSSEVGGLSYRINQLIGVLTGEEEESEE